MDDSKEKFFFGPICFLVYFFFSSWFFMLFLVYGIIKRFFPAQQQLFLSLRIAALLSFSMPLVMIVFLYHYATYDYFTLPFYQYDDFLYRPYKIYSTSFLGFGQVILWLSVFLLILGSADLLLFYLLGVVNYSTKIVYAFKRGEKVLKKEDSMGFVKKYFGNCCTSNCCTSKGKKSNKNDTENSTETKANGQDTQKKDNLKKGISYEVINVNVKKDGSIDGYELREHVRQKIQGAAYCGIFSTEYANYQLGDIVSVVSKKKNDDEEEKNGNKKGEYQYQLVDYKKWKRKQLVDYKKWKRKRKKWKRQKEPQEAKEGDGETYDWEQNGWKRVFTKTMQEIVPNRQKISRNPK